jgi:hypothetical protein
MAPLVTPIQIRDHVPAQDDGDDSRGDDEREQGLTLNVRKAQARETAQMGQTDAGKVAAADTASGDADSADREAEAPAPRRFGPVTTPIVLHRWGI